MRVIDDTGGLQRWLLSLAFITLILAVTFFIVTAYFPGDSYSEKLSDAYEFVWKNTTRTEFTDIMQDHPWTYVIPSIGILVISGWQLPRKYYGRAIFAYIVFGIGFVGGHVFW